MNIVSKNSYAALGNDPNEDSDREESPVKVIDKTPARSTKRNAPAEAPSTKHSAPAEGRGGRRGGYSGNEGAFRDRNAGSAINQGKSTENGPQDRRGGREGRGGRGGRGARQQMDRHSRGVGGDSEKQASHGWGANEGKAELADENAGDAMAQAEQKDALVNDGDNPPVDSAGEPAVEPEAEPEDNNMSYADYQAQQAEKKLALAAGALEPRKPNEGKQDKKWANAKPIAKEEDEDFIAGSGGKAKRERERKQKQVVEIDQRFVEPDRGRGGIRGGRGRGDGPARGRGDGPARGGRGDFRGGRGDGRGRGGRGDFRGGHRNGPRGGSSINTEDTSAFPSLGA